MVQGHQNFEMVKFIQVSLFLLTRGAEKVNAKGCDN